MNTLRRRGRRAIMLLAAAPLLAALAVCVPPEARAQWSTSGTTTSTTNRVGVGTTTPEQTFHVNGAEILSTGSESGFKFRNRGSAAAADDWVWYSDGNIARFWRSGVGDLLGFNTSGYLGLGTISPAARLDVKGAANIWDGARYAVTQGFMTPGSLTVGNITANFGGGSGWTGNTAGLMLEAADNTEIAVHDANTRLASFMFYEGAAVNRLTIGRDMGWGAVSTVAINGNVGVGKQSPAYKLDVAGNVNGAGLCIAGDCKTSWAQVGGGSGGSQWTTSGTSLFYNSGNVGVGTDAPVFRLDVMSTTDKPFRVSDTAGREYFSTGSQTGPFAHWTTPVVSLSGGRLIVQSNAPEGDNHTLIRRVVNSIIFNPSDHPNLPGGIAVRQKGGATVLWIDQNTNGNVHIGTGATGSTLHVAGDINVSGNINAKYQDVAEWVPSTQKLAAGTVVILDVAHNNHVATTTKAYDTRVAGVISAQPGIALGEAGEGKALVATTGRVRVRVDATRAPINIGDLLVTSETPGVAMRSEPLELGGVPIHRPGTIIGKALEPLAKGTGEILVLLSLQ